MERTAEGTTDPWSIRQVAAFHAFDVVNGRSLWITIKGNDILQKRIMEDSVELPIHKGAMESDVGASFAASLATHLIFFRWCEQNWRWFVRDMEDPIRSSLVQAKTMPIESEPRFTPIRRKTETGFSASSGGSDLRFPRVSRFRGSLLQSLRGPRATTFDLASTGTRREPEGMLVLNMFSYKDLQKLSTLAERLEEATLVIQLNVGVLRDVYEYYQDAVQPGNIADEEVRCRMAKETQAFLRRLQQIVKSMETGHTQLVSLRKRLDSGKSLVSQRPNQYLQAHALNRLRLNSTRTSCTCGVCK